MKEITSEELKRIQIEILDSFDAFCRRNHIKYWLDYGTLLGAVRHKGFIPWDDDVDVAMLREDYEKASKMFGEQSGGRFEFQTPTNSRDYCYPFGKVIDKNTVLYEYEERGIKTGVYIDVFVYDNAPEDKKAVARRFKRRDFWGRVRRTKLPLRKNLGAFKELAYRISALLMWPISNNYICRRLDRNARKYEKDAQCTKVSSFIDPYDDRRFCVSKSMFQNLIELEFEGKNYFAPGRYDEWLTLLYGRYMELPPPEQRINHHDFKAYYPEKE